MATPQGQPPKAGGNKPGAMTMAMQAVGKKPVGPKVLRIALFKGGRGTEERIIRRRETVSIGTSEKNHFIVQAAGVPAKFDLFQIVNDEYILNFTDQMGGRVGLPGGVEDLKTLRSSGRARNAGGYWQIKLDPNSKGKIRIGDVMLLFQFVVPPPITPRPQLPAAARGGFVAGIDWLFTAFVVFSYMTFFGFVIYLENADWEIDQGLSAVPESLARLIFDEPLPPPDPVDEPDEPTDEPTEEPTEEAPQQTNNTSNSNSNDSSSNSNDVNTNADARARIANEAAATAEALILGAFSDEGGALADVLQGGAALGNSADILGQTEGVSQASSAGGTLRTQGGGGSGSGGGMLGELANMGGGMTVATGSVMERRIRGRINLQAGGDIGGSGDFDSAIVVRTIRARLRAIQRCYETELRRNPTLQGKVTVQFTIVERGTVSNARSTENTTGSPAVATCVVSTVRRFRFNPGPDGGSVQFSYPFVFAPQN